MPDREKVIREFRNWCEAMADECPVICIHVLDLLKEQEAVEPQIAPFPDTSRSDGSWYYVCGTCYGPIDPKDKYCRHCGKAVKWE